MQYLLDTGVLLRLVIRADPLHAQVRQAVGFLKNQGHQTVTLVQNVAEFWNVCTRPQAARSRLMQLVLEIVLALVSRQEDLKTMCNFVQFSPSWTR